MFRRALLAATALCMPLIAMPVLHDGYSCAAENPQRKRVRHAVPTSSRHRRSRGPQAHPKRRRNLVTHSRRVRRKHRRAA